METASKPPVYRATTSTLGQEMNSEKRSKPDCQRAFRSVQFFDRTRSAWVGLPEGTFLPLDRLRWQYRTLFLEGLEKAYRAGALTFPGQWQAIACATDFARWLAPLAAVDWVVRVRSVWDRRGSQDVEATAKTVDYLSNMG